MKVYLSGYRFKNSLLSLTSIAAIAPIVDDFPAKLLNEIYACSVEELEEDSDILERIDRFKIYYQELSVLEDQSEGMMHRIRVKKTSQTLALRLAIQNHDYQKLEIIHNHYIPQSSDLETTLVRPRDVGSIPELKLSFIMAKLAYLKKIKYINETYVTYKGKHNFKACAEHLDLVIENGVMKYHDTSKIEEALVDYICEEVNNHTVKGEALMPVVNSLPNWWKHIYDRESFRDCVSEEVYKKVMANNILNLSYDQAEFIKLMSLPCRFKFSKKFIKFLQDNPPYDY